MENKNTNLFVKLWSILTLVLIFISIFRNDSHLNLIILYFLVGLVGIILFNKKNIMKIIGAILILLEVVLFILYII